MSRVVNLKKGLNIELKGDAEKVLGKTSMAKSYSVKPTDFAGLTPRLCVKQGDEVKAGTPLFYDKYRPEVMFVSPVSGTVSAVVRGDRRKLLEVVVLPHNEQTAEQFSIDKTILQDREKLIELMLLAGVWPFIIQRPYGVIADPKTQPKAIFISGFDTAPLSLDMDFVMTEQIDPFQKGIDVLQTLAGKAKVHLGLNAQDTGSCLAKRVKNVEVNLFTGKHPAGNVGVQIHHIDPIAKGEIVWTIDVQLVAALGRFVETGKYPAERIIALAGSEVKRPQYYRILSGANISCFEDQVLFTEDVKIRYISGNVLTGTQIAADGHLGFYHNQISLIPEGNQHEFVGWAAPRLNKFSASKSYFSWLMPGKKFRLDTNLNGGERAFVMTAQYESVLPMDIYPVYLLKAILAEDIDKMEQLGIYEVIEEDLALCEFVCTSKMEVQDLLRKGITTIQKEMS